MKVKELNIKQDMPPADVAVALMEIELETLANSDIGAVKVIHGYGSNGKGGAIKKQARQKLRELKHIGKIWDFVEGERWGKTSIEQFDIAKNFPELLLEADLQSFNNGVTLVFLNQSKKTKV